MEDPEVLAAVVGGFFGVLGGLVGAALRLWIGRAGRQETARLAKEAHTVTTAISTGQQRHEGDLAGLESRLRHDVEVAVQRDLKRFGAFWDLRVEVVRRVYAQLLRAENAVWEVIRASGLPVEKLANDAHAACFSAFDYAEENAIVFDEDVLATLRDLRGKLLHALVEGARGVKYPEQFESLQEALQKLTVEVKEIREDLRRRFRRQVHPDESPTP